MVLEFLGFKRRAHYYESELEDALITHLQEFLMELGQLQMYVNYFDRMVKLPDENPTIGILLCTEKNDTAVRMTLPENNSTIIASKYELYLPSTEQLVEEVEEGKREFDRQQQMKADG